MRDVGDVEEVERGGGARAWLRGLVLVLGGGHGVLVVDFDGEMGMRAFRGLLFTATMEVNCQQSTETKGTNTDIVNPKSQMAIKRQGHGVMLS